MGGRRRHRGVQDCGRRNGRSVVSFFYQNRQGGNVFTPRVLESIRKFKTFLMDKVPDLREHCYGNGDTCHPFNFIAPYFFPDGEHPVDNIDHVLPSFPGYHDQYDDE